MRRRIDLTVLLAFAINFSLAFLFNQKPQIDHGGAHSHEHQHKECPCPLGMGRSLHQIDSRISHSQNRGPHGAMPHTIMAARRRGRGGGGWSRRRRQDANLVKFDKYGFPIPPKKSAKEQEEEHQKWMESFEPEEGFPAFNPEEEGFLPEEIENDALAGPATASPAEAAAAAAASTAVPTPPQAAAAAAAAAAAEPMETQDYEADYDNIPQFGGEFLGMDDPMDAPWRKKGEDLIRQAVSEAGFEMYDLTWHLHHVNIDIINKEDDGSPTSDHIVDVTRAIEEALFPHDRDLKILQRFHLCIGTPGAKDILTTEKEFTAFRGFEVYVTTRNPVNESAPQNVRMGRLMERNPVNTIINIKGRNVTILNDMIVEVKLPEAMHEEDDFELLDDDWGSLFTNGKVPTLQCEYDFPGLVTMGAGVKMIEPTELYTPPVLDEEGEPIGEAEQYAYDDDNVVDVE